MKWFNDAYLRIISQMKKPGQMVKRLTPFTTPKMNEFFNRGCV